MSEQDFLARITYSPEIFGGKAIIRGKRLAVEHLIGLLAPGHTITARLLYARRAVGNERIKLSRADAT